MSTHWAIDLGTSNTTICEDRAGRPHIVNLPDLAKIEPVTQTPAMPTCVCVMDRDGGQVLIGQQAVTYNWDGRATGFARGFKRYLGLESGRAMARVDGRSFTAQDVASLFVREVISTLESRFGEEVTDVTIATPSGFYETYRAQLQAIVRRVKRRGWWERIWARFRGKPTRIAFRTLDEPVAAALGYGVDVGRPTTLVAFDFGGGSMEAAVVRTHGARTMETGQAEVLAKQAVELGGDDIDQWILERFVPLALHDWPEWEVALRWEAERVKLLASAGSKGDFTFRNESFGWLPFEAVARGACIFAGGAHVEDFIYHDYALRVLPDDHDDAEYELLIPGGTRFPTVDNFVTRYYAPGFDGQQHINLFICEVGRVAGRPVAWTERASGSRYFVPGTAGERAFCLCLNEADPALPLSPAGKGTAPRLRVTYSVDENRRLCVTVHDLHRKTDLRVKHPVVRLR